MNVPDDEEHPESFRRGAEAVLDALDAFSDDLGEHLRPDPHETDPDACPDCGHERFQSGVSMVCPECDL
jgi:hypothetical protein